MSGIRTSTATGLRAAIASHSLGDQVSITWTAAGGDSHTGTVTLASGPVSSSGQTSSWYGAVAVRPSFNPVNRQ